MGKYSLVDIIEGEKGTCEFKFENSDANAVAQDIKSLFLGRKYRIKQGNEMDGVYMIGSSAMRFWFGAFHKHYAFGIKVTPDGQDCTVRLTIGLRNFMAKGGIIGAQNQQGEFLRWKTAIKNL